MSESRKGKTAPNRTYQKWSNDTRAKQANARKEYWESEAGQRRKAEMSKRRRGKNNHFCGKTHSDETKQTLSNQKKGKKRDPVAVEKTRQKMLGRKHTEETKRKISESMKGNTNRKRPS